MTSHPILIVSNLTYTYAGRLLFRDLCFEVCPGDAIVLVGPNGSGKTTLLRCMAGIPESRPAIIKNKGLKQSYVGHLNALKLHQTVRQNLLNQTGATSERLMKILLEKRLSSLLDREVRTLSVGQRRQVALARLPLSETKLWLVDEPTTHLDKTAAAHFWEMMEKHLKTGGAAVLTSHAPVPLSKTKVITLNG
ncbi:MAG: heme ABC exporter ATP-binding protein CcmA [Alphaproteobacteria bacterium]|nr:heme ABC exporter ATP-binding protein CcmA [Alphaproteobacteria bacterium]